MGYWCMLRITRYRSKRTTHTTSTVEQSAEFCELTFLTRWQFRWFMSSNPRWGFCWQLGVFSSFFLLSMDNTDFVFCFLFFGHILLHFLCIFTQLGLSRVTVKRYITEGDGARKGRVRWISLWAPSFCTSVRLRHPWGVMANGDLWRVWRITRQFSFLSITARI